MYYITQIITPSHFLQKVKILQKIPEFFLFSVEYDTIKRDIIKYY